MTATSFASILSAAPADIERTPPLPIGTYICSIGQFELPRTETSPATFPLTVVGVLEDVDAEALQAAGGTGGKILRYTVWPDERAAEALDTLHAYAGLDLAELSDKGIDRAERNEMVMNSQILAVVKHRTDKNDPSKVYAEVQRIARAD